MSTVIERRPLEADEEQVPTDGLFQVWIDLGKPEAGIPSDWWWNSPPQPLSSALDEATECRAKGFAAKVMPEGTNPRPDGRWDNP